MFPTDHLSYSSISTFLDCAQRWKRIYIDKEPKPQTIDTLFGSLFHQTVAQFLSNKRQKLEDIWESTCQKSKLSLPSDYVQKGNLLFSSPHIESELSKLQPYYIDAEPVLEKEFQFSSASIPIPVKGFVDCVLADGTVVDFKTFGSKFHWESYWLQPAIYLRGVRTTFGIGNKFKFISFSKNSGFRIETYVVNLSKEDVEDKLDALLEFVWYRMNLFIKNNNFPLNTSSPFCNEKLCPFWANCVGKLDLIFA